MISLLKSVSEDLETQIARFADESGKVRKEQLAAMKARVDEALEGFKEHYSYLMDLGVSTITDLILERNGEIFMEVEGTRKLVDTLKYNVIDELAKMREKDGLILSDRIWRMTEEAKLDITNKIQKGILLGESHVKVAKEIRGYIVSSGGLRYKSERLVLSEMARAYKHANEMAVEQMRQNSKYMWFEKWELSPAHPRPDVCDILASQDMGEGPGVYKKAPNRHPGCYCYIYPVYRLKKTEAEYPSVSPMEPKLDEMTAADKKLAKELTQ